MPVCYSHPCVLFCCNDTPSIKGLILCFFVFLDIKTRHYCIYVQIKQIQDFSCWDAKDTISVLVEGRNWTWRLLHYIPGACGRAACTRRSAWSSPWPTRWCSWSGSCSALGCWRRAGSDFLRRTEKKVKKRRIDLLRSALRHNLGTTQRRFLPQHRKVF